MLSLVATAALEKALNQCLQLDPETLKQVTALEGNVVALEIQGTGQTIFLVPTAEGLRVQSIFEGEPEVTIRGGLFSLARLGVSDTPSAVLGDGVEMEGDAQLGHKIQHILNSLDLDWEEQLSKITGDVIAHQIGNNLSDLVDWGKKTGETFARDIGEYFQEESRDLVVKAELKPFLDAVDELRMDSDRLAQRIQNLHNKIKTKGNTA